MKLRRSRALAVALFIPGVVLLMASVAVAASVDPVLFEGPGANGNPFCTAPTDNQVGLGLDPITKFESPSEGVSEQDGVTVDLDVEGGTVLSWDSGEILVGAVIVKGGNNANVYFYPGGATSDTNLVTPLNNGGQTPAISHVDFCAAAEEEPSPSPTETETEEPTEEPTVLPTQTEQEEPSEEPSVLPRRLSRTGPADSMVIATAGAGMLLLGLAFQAMPRRKEIVVRH